MKIIIKRATKKVDAIRCCNMSTTAALLSVNPAGTASVKSRSAIVYVPESCSLMQHPRRSVFLSAC